ncbi:3-beta hydroxysteroid dehydrogenase [Kaistia sp. 32K]|uniref:NAD(P)-dependent oxidoreductase n=1 Tax=Kaistia sp. 32K TaxID=2795690 RepID=UPI001914EA74|nr:NAD(P)H-binding protein [Kaistia sp. 32K]BCP52888.1 3-beta hydroxysteroid dehydrogenase [Kaistia sp. 32K]
MKIAVIGATGFVGSAVVAEALARGHQVGAIARHPEKLAEAPGLTRIVGDVRDADRVAALVAGYDYVVSAYNPGWTNPDIYNEYLLGAAAIVAGVKKAGLPLLVVGGAGSLEVAPGVQAVDLPEFPETWKPGALAARDGLNEIRKETELDWTFLSPAAFLEHDTPRTGRYRLGGDNPVVDPATGTAHISIGDLAVAVLDEAEARKHKHRRFTVGV